MSPDPETRFDALYTREYGAVRAYAVRRVGPESADDVVAETFMIAWRTLDRLPADPRPWLFGIARNVLRHQHRQERRQHAIRDRLARQPAPAPPVGADADDADALAALAALPERDREIVMLVCWEGLSLVQAARVIGTTHVAARVRLHRARGRLRTLLEPPAAATPTQEPT